MSFLKSLFAKKEAPTARKLTTPKDLQLNDIFTFSDSFSLPEAMRKQQLQAITINTVEFSHEHYAQIIGQGSGDELIYVSFPDNPKNLIKLSLLLNRNDVETLFDLDAFSEIFEQPGKARLKPLTTNHSYSSMVADEYIQHEFMVSGYLHNEDYRGKVPPQNEEDQHGREFEFYSLEGGAGERSIDIFIFENGDTDVYLSFFRPISEISELWVKGE